MLEILRCVEREATSFSSKMVYRLAGRQDGRVIAIREDAAGGIKVSGIHAETCGTEEEMFRCLSDGSVQRTTGATLMNEQSSRWGGWLKKVVCVEKVGWIDTTMIWQ